MSNPIVIALDAMGGDHAPDMVLRGANIACERYRDVEFLLFGPEDELKPKLERLKLLRRKSTICHANSVVTNEMKPSVALRSGRDSSMRLALNAVKEGKAHASFSAGNTGALMAMAKFVLGMVDGIHRPAIASMVPTEKGESVMLDLGANLECSAKNLVQFAILGEVFSRSLFSWDAPSVGLLNVGSEEFKGKEEVKEAARILKLMSEQEAGSSLNFKGFVEGNQIMTGEVDVIVADGFSGNVALNQWKGLLSFTAKQCVTSLRARLWPGSLISLVVQPLIAYAFVLTLGVITALFS